MNRMVSLWKRSRCAYVAVFLGAFLGLGLYAPEAALAVTRIGAGGTGSGSANSINVTIPATTAGNTLIAVVGSIWNGNNVSSITGGGTWTRATSGANTGGPETTELWYCPNITGGVTTVTVNFTNAVNEVAAIQEYSGVLTASPLDKVANANGATSAQNSGTTTATAQANELWIAGFSSGVTGAYSGASAGWTIVQNTGATIQVALVENLTNSATTANCTITGPNFSWGGTVATFLPAAAAGNLNIGNGATVANANAQQGSANNAMDSFTMFVSAGTGQVNSVTLTTGAQFTAANVTNISVYNDAGTLGVYDAGVDTLVPTTFSIGASTATLTFTTPVSVTTTTANYLITVNIAAAATTGNTLTGRVTGASGSNLGAPAYNDLASATLTISAPVCTYANPTVTLTPSSQSVAPGGTITYTIQVTNNDSSACAATTFNLSKTDLPATPNANFNASTLPATIGPINGGGSFQTATLTVTTPSGATLGATETTSVTTAADANHGAVTSAAATSTVATVAPGPPQASPAGNNALYFLLAVIMVAVTIIKGRNQKKDTSV